MSPMTCLQAGIANLANPNCLQLTIFLAMARAKTFSFTCSANLAAVARAHDFLAESVRCYKKTSGNVKGAALFVHVSLDVDAEHKDEPSSCADKCAQKMVYQPAVCGVS